VIDPIGDRDALVSALRLIASEPVMNDRSRAILTGGFGSGSVRKLSELGHTVKLMAPQL
jgi:hypothetical protein